MRLLPEDVEALIEDLEEYYPPRCKDPAETLEQHAFYAGQVELVRVLRERYEYTMQQTRI